MGGQGDSDVVGDAVREILSRFEPGDVTGERAWNVDLWRALADAGFTGAGLAESAGGSGGTLADAVAVVAALAAGGAAVPVAEQLLVSAPALVSTGLSLPSLDEPLTFAIADAVTADPSAAGWVLTGSVSDVPWAGTAARAVFLTAGPAGPVLALTSIGALDCSAVPNLAGEPRGQFHFDRTPAEATAVPPEQADHVRARYALARAVQLAAAEEQLLSWTLEYAKVREQFGRPIGSFQAVQMELALMAGEVATAAASTDAAVAALDAASDGFVLAAAAAKVRAGGAVERVARVAHQVHGAIGFTREHRLHRLTRRCWAWREEAGSELHWSTVLGAALASHPDGLWPALTTVE